MNRRNVIIGGLSVAAVGLFGTTIDASSHHRMEQDDISYNEGSVITVNRVFDKTINEWRLFPSDVTVTTRPHSVARTVHQHNPTNEHIDECAWDIDFDYEELPTLQAHLVLYTPHTGVTHFLANRNDMLLAYHTLLRSTGHIRD